MITDQHKKILEGQYVGLATIDDNNCPNLVAVEVNKIIDDDKILITDNFFNKTKNNILKNPSVSIACWLGQPLTGFQFKGTAEYFTEGEYKELVIQLNPGLPCRGYILVTVTEIWDLANPGLITKE